MTARGVAPATRRQHQRLARLLPEQDEGMSTVRLDRPGAQANRECPADRRLSRVAPQGGPPDQSVLPQWR